MKARKRGNTRLLEKRIKLKTKIRMGLIKMIAKTLIMVGIHKETVDGRGKIITPASIIKIYEDDALDCFGDKMIATSEQVYARKNRKIDWTKNILRIGDFKGAKGISENFYEASYLNEYIEMLIDDGYSIKRITKHQENNLADTLFKNVMKYEMKKANKVLNF